MHRFLFTSGNIVFSFVLGAVALAVCAIWFEDAFARILDVAVAVKTWLTNLGIPNRYNNFIRLLVHESAIMFAGFTIVSRLIVSAFANALLWIWTRARGA